MKNIHCNPVSLGDQKLPYVIALVYLLVSTGFAQQQWGDTASYPPYPVYTRANAPAAPALADLSLKDSISQYEYTWRFSSPVRAGQFINGDWYVVGPCTVIGITPKPMFGKEVTDSLYLTGTDNESKWYPDEVARNGSIVNPKHSIYQGIDSRIAYGHYDPGKFVHLPVTLKPGDVLVSTQSNATLATLTAHRRPIKSGAVLTCLSGPQPADAFRPGFADTSVEMFYTRDLKRNLLYNLPLPADAPDLAEWTGKFKRPWLDITEWGLVDPEINMPEYNQWMTWGVSRVSLMVHLNYPAGQKEALLVNFIQYGIDVWGLIKSGHRDWTGHGGYNQGRKWALLFAGIMLGDTAMQKVMSVYPTMKFGEDTQTGWGTNWQGDTVLFESHPRWRATPAETYHPSQWSSVQQYNGTQSCAYMVCCTSKEWVGEALAMRMMRAEPIFGHDPFFAHVDRWMRPNFVADLYDSLDGIYNQYAARGDTLDWPMIPSTFSWWKSTPKTTQPFETTMWNLYRGNLPVSISAVKETNKPSFLFLRLTPGPFNNAVRITYDLPYECETVFGIFSISGKNVRTLFRGKKPAGPGTLAWDMTDNSGQRVPSGVYVIDISASDGRISKLFHAIPYHP